MSQQRCKQHEWVVFSTALGEHWLILQCVGCGLHATVEDPSEAEWGQAFHAPSQPYRWLNEIRLVIHPEHPPDQRYVQRAPPSAKKCPCHAKLGVPEPGDYERVWIEATRPKPKVKADVRRELLELAAAVEESSELCSTVFNFFIQSFQKETGVEPSHAVRSFAKQIEKLWAMGVHCSSSVIATLLRELAKP